jgi:hypothetical protein
MNKKNSLISYIKIQYIKPHFVIYMNDKLIVENRFGAYIYDIMNMNILDFVNIAKINKDENFHNWWISNRQKILNNFYALRGK